MGCSPAARSKGGSARHARWTLRPDPDTAVSSRHGAALSIPEGASPHTLTRFHTRSQSVSVLPLGGKSTCSHLNIFPLGCPFSPDPNYKQAFQPASRLKRAKDSLNPFPDKLFQNILFKQILINSRKTSQGQRAQRSPLCSFLCAHCGVRGAEFPVGSSPEGPHPAAQVLCCSADSIRQCGCCTEPASRSFCSPSGWDRDPVHLPAPDFWETPAPGPRPRSQLQAPLPNAHPAYGLTSSHSCPLLASLQLAPPPPHGP